MKQEWVIIKKKKKRKPGSKKDAHLNYMENFNRRTEEQNGHN